MRQVCFGVKNNVSVWDPDPRPARSTILNSLVSDTPPVCRSLHVHNARRCTCGQRAFRASVCALSLNTSSWVSVSIKHVRVAHQHVALGRKVPCSIDGLGHARLPLVSVSSVASSLFVLAGGRRVWVGSGAFVAGGCTYASDAARRGKTAAATVVSAQTGH